MSKLLLITLSILQAKEMLQAEVDQLQSKNGAVSLDEYTSISGENHGQFTYDPSKKCFGTWVATLAGDATCLIWLCSSRGVRDVTQ